MVVSSSFQEISPTRFRLNVRIPAEKVKSTSEDVLNTYQKKSDIKGFRKGKAPLPMVKKAYFNDITRETLNGLIEHGYQEAIKNVEFQIVSDPQIDPIKEFHENQDLEFSAQIDVNPKVDMKDYKGALIKLPKALAATEEEGVQDLLKSFARFTGQLVPLEESAHLEKDAVVKISYSLAENDVILADKSVHEQTFGLGDQRLLKELEDALIGTPATVGSRRFSIQISADGPSDLAGKKLDVDLNLHSAQKLEVPPLDDALAIKMGYKSVEDMRQGLLAVVQNRQNEARADAAFPQLVAHILEKNSFEVAESLVENAISQSINLANSRLPADQKLDDKNPEIRENFRTEALHQVKGVLALSHIARQESITVSQEELIHTVREFCMVHQIDPRKLAQRAGPQIYDELKGQTLIRKVVSHLLQDGNSQIQYES